METIVVVVVVVVFHFLFGNLKFQPEFNEQVKAPLQKFTRFRAAGKFCLFFAPGQPVAHTLCILVTTLSN